MIGFLEGKVVASDGMESILLTSSGIGYQIHYPRLLSPGIKMEVYIGHIIRENGEELFAFDSLEEKKVFELLNTVRGIGPRSSYSLINMVGVKGVVNSIARDNKKALTRAKGIGPKAAGQIVLDLKDKVRRIPLLTQATVPNSLLEDALVACKGLGLEEERVLPLAEKILQREKIKEAESLVRLILKEV